MDYPDVESFIALSKARNRYWWVLGTVGLFYLALSARFASAIGDVGEVLFPMLPGLPVDARVVWAAGPAVLAFLLIGILGIFRARVSVLARLEVSAKVKIVDELMPTFVDMLAYEPRDTWWFWRVLKQFIYPVVLSLFFLEAVFILWSAWLVRSLVPYWPVLLSMGLLALLAVLPGLGAQWLLYFRYTRAIRRREA